MPSIFQVFCEKYKGGCGAYECKKAKHICLVRGVVPCDICFIGEAPGEVEDIFAQPFVGPAGERLSYIAEKAIPTGITSAFTNMVGCIPRMEDGGKATEPSLEQIFHCSTRLKEFVRIADPRLVVTVGTLSRDWLEPGYMQSIKLHRKIPQVAIVHPAYILRQTPAMQRKLTKDCIVDLRSAVGRVFQLGDGNASTREM